MNFKPGDFFIGVENFFAILVPGVFATFLLQRLYNNELQILLNTTVSSETIGGIAFLLVSYGVGHLVSAVGALLDELFFDYLYDFRFGRRDKAADDVSHEVEEILRKRFNSQDNDQLVRQDQSPLKYFKNIKVLKWAAIIVNLDRPEAGNDLARIKADVKFLRNLVPVILLSYGTTLYVSKWEYHLLILHVIVILMLSVRYVSLQRKYKQATYSYLVAINRA